MMNGGRFTSPMLAQSDAYFYEYSSSGMRRLLKLICVASSLIAILGTSVRAADLAASVSQFQNYDWTGLYAGGDVGYQWVQGSTAALSRGQTAFAQQGVDGFVGIVQGGYNWQIPNWWDMCTMVIGLEVDGAVSAAKVGHSVTLGAETFDVFASLPWLTTMRGRFGVPVGLFGQWLIYGTAGAGYAKINSTAIVTGPFVDSLNGSSGRAVWVAGGGVEYGISRYWSWKLEYTYAETGAVTNLTPSAPGHIQLSTGRISDQAVRTGINFHF
jgi:outer membrane immunogenic protein